jgi:hypothetical protein
MRYYLGNWLFPSFNTQEKMYSFLSIAILRNKIGIKDSRLSINVGNPNSVLRFAGSGGNVPLARCALKRGAANLAEVYERTAPLQGYSETHERRAHQFRSYFSQLNSFLLVHTT